MVPSTITIKPKIIMPIFFWVNEYFSNITLAIVYAKLSLFRFTPLSIYVYV
jgi:hypothetical protein